MIFGNEATKINDPSQAQPGEQTTTLSFKTRSLTFFNLLKGSGVTKYFDYLKTEVDEKEKKVARIEAIFLDEFDVEFEAERLDAFISVLSEFTTFTDAENLDAFSSEMRSLIELTYALTDDVITQRAFMVSEMSAGFFTDIFDSEYDLVVDPAAPYFNDTENLALRVNFYSTSITDTVNDFVRLNPIEAAGIEAALLFLSAIKGVAESGGTPSTNDIEAMQFALNQMGTKLAYQVTALGPYPNYVTADFATWDDAEISEIARLFYAARVVTNAGFIGLSNSMLTLTSNPFAGFVETSLLLEPYATNFVFEIEGEKIAYVFA
jgi:hypothetical protein